MLRLKKSACQFPAEYQFRMILVLTFLLVLLCSCQASLAKQQGPQEQVSCCNGELHEPAYSSHTSLFFSQCSQVRIFWQCCDLHAVLMPHRGETWKLNLPNEEEKTFHIDTQPSKCTGICHFFVQHHMQLAIFFGCTVSIFCSTSAVRKPIMLSKLICFSRVCIFYSVPNTSWLPIRTLDSIYPDIFK